MAKSETDNFNKISNYEKSLDCFYLGKDRLGKSFFIENLLSLKKKKHTKKKPPKSNR